MQSISLSHVTFSYPASDEILKDISTVFDNASKIAIVGDNGCGKTTLFKIISGDLSPDSGSVIRNATVHLLPQIAAFDAKSGGERQQAALQNAFASGADILLLDEPTNNLDESARKDFFKMLRLWNGGAVIISHDRDLLNQIDRILELSNGDVKVFGGNYDFYVAAKKSAREKLESKYANVENNLNRLAAQKRKSDEWAAHGMGHIDSSQKGKSHIRIKTRCLTEKVEQSASKKKNQVTKEIDKFDAMRQELSNQMRDDRIKIPMPSKPMTRNDLVIIENMAFGYDKNIFNNFELKMRGNERIHIAGFNGSGKTSLIKLILGQLTPQSGTIKLFGRVAYLDQDLSLLNRNKTVVENISEFASLNQNEAYSISANFGFRNRDATKRVGVLSGGELLRATLAAVIGTKNQPDMIILDEPTNNLDIKSIEILEDALNQYMGAIMVISHDQFFINSLEIDRTVWL